MARSPPGRPRSRAALAAATALGATAILTERLAYPVMFGSFAPYDDEGYLLVSVRAYLRGERLYDDIFSQYGPLFHEGARAAFALSGLPVSHDAGRLITLALWLAVSLLCGAVAWMMTRRILVAVAAQLLALLTLVPLRNEPLHPGAPLSLLLVLLVAAACAVPRWPRAATAAMGALAAAALFIKINIGALAMLSIGFACVVALPPRPAPRWLRLGAAALLIAAPFALMARDLGQPWAMRYALHVGAAALALAIAAGAVEPGIARPTRAGALAWMAIGAAVATLYACGVPLARGTRLASLVNGVLLQPLRQPVVFEVPLHLPQSAALLALAAVAGSILARAGLFPFASARGGGAPLVLLAGALLRLAAGVGSWWTVVGVGPLPPLGIYALPAAWIAVLPPRREGAPASAPFARVVLVSLATLQSLHAYPVAGSQVAFSALLLIPVGALLVGDGLDALSRGLAAAGVGGAMLRDRALPAALSALLVAGAGAALVARQRPLREAYAAGVPLPFPGARRLHLPPTQRDTYVWLSGQIARHCATFVSLPGMNSLYLFSGREPPTSLNATSWMYLFDARTQMRIVERIRGMNDLCAVRNDDLLRFWAQQRPVPEGPLLAYIRAELTPVRSRDGFVLLARPSRALDAP